MKLLRSKLQAPSLLGLLLLWSWALVAEGLKSGDLLRLRALEEDEPGDDGKPSAAPCGRPGGAWVFSADGVLGPGQKPPATGKAGKRGKGKDGKEKCKHAPAPPPKTGGKWVPTWVFKAKGKEGNEDDDGEGANGTNGTTNGNITRAKPFKGRLTDANGAQAAEEAAKTAQRQAVELQRVTAALNKEALVNATLTVQKTMQDLDIAAENMTKAAAKHVMSPAHADMVHWPTKYDLHSPRVGERGPDGEDPPGGPTLETSKEAEASAEQADKMADDAEVAAEATVAKLRKASDAMAARAEILAKAEDDARRKYIERKAAEKLKQKLELMTRDDGMGSASSGINKAIKEADAKVDEAETFLGASLQAEKGHRDEMTVIRRREGKPAFVLSVSNYQLPLRVEKGIKKLFGAVLDQVNEIFDPSPVLSTKNTTKKTIALQAKRKGKRGSNSTLGKGAKGNVAPGRAPLGANALGNKATGKAAPGTPAKGRNAKGRNAKGQGAKKILLAVDDKKNPTKDLDAVFVDRNQNPLIDLEKTNKAVKLLDDMFQQWANPKALAEWKAAEVEGKPIDKPYEDVVAIDRMEYEYTYSSKNDKFEKVPGRMSEQTIGNNYVWGLLKYDKGADVLKCKKPCKGAWYKVTSSDPQLKTLEQIDAGADYLYARNHNFKVFRRKVDGSGDWESDGSLDLKHVSIGNGFVWGVTPGNDVRKKDVSDSKKPGKWEKASGKFDQLDCGFDEVWAVNSQSGMVAMAPLDGGKNFAKVTSWPGKPVHITVGHLNIWGLNDQDELYKCSRPCKGTWNLVDGEYAWADAGWLP